MKLVAVVLSQPIRNLRPALDHLEIGKTKPYEKWTAFVRGPSLFIVSQPGFRPGQAESGDARRVYEIPRASCTLIWEADAEDPVLAAPGDDLSGLAAGVPLDKAQAKGTKPSKPAGLDATKAPE